MDIKNLRLRAFAANFENAKFETQGKNGTLAQVFYTYAAYMQEISDADKLNLLINRVDASVYELISEATAYNDAAEILASTYAKRSNPIFAR